MGTVRTGRRLGGTVWAAGLTDRLGKRCEIVIGRVGFGEVTVVTDNIPTSRCSQP
jgi:hypothetical protein